MEYLLLGEYRDWALLILRVVMGIVFIYYGWPKLRDLKSNARDFEGMGFKPGWFWGTPIALLETFGALGVILGIYASSFAILFALHMVTGTVWKITKTDKPFTDWSYDVMLLVMALILMAFGAGVYKLL